MRLEKIVKVTELNIENTVDLEIDSEDHNFYCNDICVSNSHSVSYASLAALSVYLKFKYPLDFFLESLKMAREKQDVSAEINLIQTELKFFDINLLPPDLVKSDLDFKKEGNNLRFGLSAIKGISDKTIESLKGFIQSDKANKFEVFQAAKKSGISIGILSALIQAGTLQSFGENRPALVYEAQIWNKLTDREKTFCLKYGHLYNYSLFEILHNMDKLIDDTGKPLIKEKRAETIKSKVEPYRDIFKINNKYPQYAAYYFEKSLLGFSYSQRLKNIFQKYSANQIDELAKTDYIEENDNITVVGEVIEIEEKISKNKKKYAKLKIADDSATKEVMIFEPTYSKLVSDNLIPKEKNIIILDLRKWNDTFTVQKLKLSDDRVYLKLAELKD